jgi:hypothetical protein
MSILTRLPLPDVLIAVSSDMSTKSSLALALAAGFIGGVVSHYLVPVPVQAQAQTAIPAEIRAQEFVLVDNTGAVKGAFGFEGGAPTIEAMDIKGHVYFTRWEGPGFTSDTSGDILARTSRSYWHNPTMVPRQK